MSYSLFVDTYLLQFLYIFYKSNSNVNNNTIDLANISSLDNVFCTNILNCSNYNRKIMIQKNFEN